MPIITNEGTLKGVIAPDGTLLAGDGDIRRWYLRGVPSLRGESQADGVIAEKATRIAPDDLFFGLAMMEECERRGWAFLPDEDVDVGATMGIAGKAVGERVFGGGDADIEQQAELVAGLLAGALIRTTAKVYEEGKHPRAPKGSPTAGNVPRIMRG